MRLVVAVAISLSCIAGWTILCVVMKMPKAYAGMFGMAVNYIVVTCVVLWYNKVGR